MTPVDLAFLLQYWKAAAVVALLCLTCAIGWRLGSASLRAELAGQSAEWDRLAARGAVAALERQSELQSAADAARGELEHARNRISEQDARIARLVVDSARLRRDLAAYASGAGDSDSLAACRERARRLAELATEGGSLLAEGSNLLRRAAKDRDERAAEVNALLAAWPKNSVEVY